MKRTDIQIRDPYVVPVKAEQRYYLFGTTDKNLWDEGVGFDCYHSADLENWEGPFNAFTPPPGFWADRNFWAPECHPYAGRFYLFATFKAKKHYRGTQILVADKIAGPYRPLTDGPITPPDWECLDGTLHIDKEGCPWLVFCQEWLQVRNGAIHAMKLSRDLKTAVGKPVFLFNASEAEWVSRKEWTDQPEPLCYPWYVTDGPFLYRTRSGVLLMLWSSLGRGGYTLGLARSASGHITGPWTQDREPLWEEDGGHGMVFRAFDGRLLLTLHKPNDTPNERPHFLELEDTGHTIKRR